MTLLRQTALLAAALCALAAPARAEPGFGDDNRPPTGAPFALPPGLEIAGPIVGANDDGDCPGAETEDVGSGLWVRVCVPVRNRTGSGIRVVFPAGLTLVSTSETFQNGVLVESEILTVPSYTVGGNRLREKDDDIIYIPLHLYCANSAREPTVPGADYSLGPVASPPGFAELFRIMEGRDISNDRDPVEAVQEVVYEIIREGRLTDEARATLEGLN